MTVSRSCPAIPTSSYQTVSDLPELSVPTVPIPHRRRSGLVFKHCRQRGQEPLVPKGGSPIPQGRRLLGEGGSEFGQSRSRVGGDADIGEGVEGRWGAVDYRDPGT